VARGWGYGSVRERMVAEDGKWQREGRWLRFWSKEMKGTRDGEEKSLGWFSRGAGLEAGMEADRSGRCAAEERDGGLWAWSVGWREIGRSGGSSRMRVCRGRVFLIVWLWLFFK
jgi:hypothetical protein